MGDEVITISIRADNVDTAIATRNVGGTELVSVAFHNLTEGELRHARRAGAGAWTSEIVQELVADLVGEMSSVRIDDNVRATHKWPQPQLGVDFHYVSQPRGGPS